MEAYKPRPKAFYMRILQKNKLGINKKGFIKSTTSPTPNLKRKEFPLLFPFHPLKSLHKIAARVFSSSLAQSAQAVRRDTSLKFKRHP